MAPPFVVIEYEDLISDKDLSQMIIDAYGANSVGALAIRGIPNWLDMCHQTLPLAHSLAKLPKEELDKLEDEASMYNAGWSLGKEKMGDTPDFAKASFYFNPLVDDPSPELREEYPWALPANKWPDEASIPHFKDRCKELGSVMKEVAVHLARHIDKLLVAQVPGYQAGLFHNAMDASIKAKSRLLYYFPIQPDADASKDATQGAPKTKTDNWIAWHNDSGFLTCLASEIFVDHETGERIPNPEPETAGLWIADREGVETKIFIPGDAMGIQIGECLQVLSGGLLVATPHMVRGCKVTPNVARISLPCFVDTPPTFPMCAPSGCTREDVFRHTVAQKVPPLSERWTRDGMTFAEFLGDSFKGYYEWSKK